MFKGEEKIKKITKQARQKGRKNERKKERQTEGRNEGKKENTIRIERSEFCRMLFRSRHPTASSNRQYNAQFTELHIFTSEEIWHKLLWNPPLLPYTITAAFLSIEVYSLFKTRVLRSVGMIKSTLTYSATEVYRNEDKIGIT
jgi:hypothetical protein